MNWRRYWTRLFFLAAVLAAFLWLVFTFGGGSAR